MQAFGGFLRTSHWLNRDRIVDLALVLLTLQWRVQSSSWVDERTIPIWSDLYATT